MKLKLFVAATMAMVLLAGCGSSGSSGEAAGGGAETKTGEGQGYGGTITATVTVNDGTITAVTFEGADETESIGQAAFEDIATQMVAANSADVDGVAGATVTTEGCIEAVKAAIG